MIKDLSIIATATPFNFKTLRTKPLRYLIQLVTGSRIEHIAIYCQDNVLQAVGSGVEMISLREFLYNHKESNIYKFEFIREIEPEDIAYFWHFAKKHVGQKYSAFQAAYSALDGLMKGENIKQDNKFFCSELSAQLCLELGWVKGIDPTKLSPKDWINYLNKLHLTNGREKCE